MGFEHDKVLDQSYATTDVFQQHPLPPCQLLCANLQRVILYPNYINAGKTIAEGRRISKEKGAYSTWPKADNISIQSVYPCKLTCIVWYAACEKPNAGEIFDCCTKGLKLTAQLEVRPLHPICSCVSNWHVDLSCATGLQVLQ